MMQSGRNTWQPGFDPGQRACWRMRDNIRFRQSIENVYMTAVKHAQKEVLIANAYFCPRRGLLKALERAAQRGVRVRLLLQGRSEYAMQYRASRYMYCKLLDDGIELYEYMASYLHAKVAVMDDCAMVGRSEEHTSELQSLMRISDAVFCLQKKKKQGPNHANQQILSSTSTLDI